MANCASDSSTHSSSVPTSQSTGSPPCSLRNPVSLTALEAVQRYLFDAQEKLRDVFVNDRPRLEMSIFHFIIKIFDKKLKPFLKLKRSGKDLDGGNIEEDTNEDRTESQVFFEGKYIVENALQDLFAALIFLLSKEVIFQEEEKERNHDETDTYTSKSSVFELSRSPQFYSSLSASYSQANTSSFYVSHLQRLWCSKLFFFLCWTPDIPLHFVLHSLYPLLSHTPTLASRSSDTAGRAAISCTYPPPESFENHIASNLFDGARFAWKKQLITETLNGLLCCRPSSITSLYKVFILTDRIPLEQGDAVKEVAAYLHPILIEEKKMMWKSESYVEGSPVIRITRGTLTYEEQIRTLCVQLVDLFTSHKEDKIMTHEADNSIAAWDTPSGKEYTAQIGPTGNILLPKETLEDRFHLSLVLLLNSLLYLPNESDQKAYAPHYKRYYFTNKYFLTPAFAPLTLRSTSLKALSESGDNREVTRYVDDALARLRTLLHGVQLGASTLSLTTVLENVMPGVLNLASMLDRASPTNRQTTAGKLPDKMEKNLIKLLRSFHEDPVAVDFVAEIAVRVCFPSAKSGSKGVGYRLEIQKNCVDGPSICVDSLPCDSFIFLEGIFKGILSPFFLENNSLPNEEKMSAVSCVFRSKVLFSFARYCNVLQQSLQVHMCSSIRRDSEPCMVSEKELKGATDFLVCYLTEAPASSIFTHEASLSYVFDVLCTILPLSHQCFSWSVILAAQVLEGLMLKGNFKEQSDHRAHMSLPTKQSEKNALRNQIERFKLLLQKHFSETLQYCSVSSSSEVETGNVRLVAALSALQNDRLLDDVINELQSTTNVESGAVSDAQNSSLANESENSVFSSCYVVSSLRNRHQVVLDALKRESVPLLAVALVELTRFVEECSFRGLLGKSAADVQKDVGKAMVGTLLEVLGTTVDTFSAVNVIQVLCWMGMYRWDSPNSAVLAEAIWKFLLPSVPSSSSSKSSCSSNQMVLSHIASCLLPAAERSSMFKARLLDLLLSWCDYDQQGLTLRHIDEYGLTVYCCSLMELLAILCKPDQPEVVQVAAMHCIGHYFVAVYPRVSLCRLSQLCQDAFRSTPIEMAKAACAAMLHHVMTTLIVDDGGNKGIHNLGSNSSSSKTNANMQEMLRQRVSLVLDDEKELDVIHRIATAMASYYSYCRKSSIRDGSRIETSKSASLSASQTVKMPLRATPNTENNISTSTSWNNLSELPPRLSDDHSKVIRLYGQGILDLLSLLKKNPLVQVTG